MSFVLSVSWGVTASVASQTPAPRPARNDAAMDTLPVSGSASKLRKCVFAPKRTPALGALNASTGARPL